MTCKNLLAPENGDIEYILGENERDDITILQVCICACFILCERDAVPRVFSNGLFDFISGRPAIGIQMQSRIPFKRREISDLFGDRHLGLRETVLHTLRMCSAEKVRSKHVYRAIHPF